MCAELAVTAAVLACFFFLLLALCGTIDRIAAAVAVIQYTETVYVFDEGISPFYPELAKESGLPPQLQNQTSSPPQFLKSGKSPP